MKPLGTALGRTCVVSTAPTRSGAPTSSAPHGRLRAARGARAAAAKCRTPAGSSLRVRPLSRRARVSSSLRAVTVASRSREMVAMAPGDSPSPCPYLELVRPPWFLADQGEKYACRSPPRTAAGSICRALSPLACGPACCAVGLCACRRASAPTRSLRRASAVPASGGVPCSGHVP